MKRYLKAVLKVAGVATPLVLLGAGQATTYLGVVRSVESKRITILQKSGAEKTLKFTADTRAYASGKLVPATFLKRNSKVQASVDEHDVCIQIVADEVPR